MPDLPLLAWLTLYAVAVVVILFFLFGRRDASDAVVLAGSVGRRGGGYCLKCGRANYAVEWPEPRGPHPKVTKEDHDAIRELQCCGWCGASLGGVVLKVLPDIVEARKAVRYDK